MDSGAFSGEERGVKFDFSDLTELDYKQLFKNVPNDKVCVVSVIGKSSINSQEFKSSIIDEILGKNIFQSPLGERTYIDTNTNSNITGYLDPSSQTIFLHLSEISDTGYIVQKCKDLENELKKKNFLELWSDLQYNYAKSLLLLFSVSHIIMVVHPNSSFDLSYIHLFRTLETIRKKALPWFVEQLRGCEISNDWIQAGRPCSPRVLFIFETCPINLSVENCTNTVEKYAPFKTKRLPPLKKLEHSTEDQIYRILRKSRIITNISGNSLFAVPLNQEFVYMFSSKPHITHPVGFFLSLLRKHCQKAKECDMTGTKSRNMLNCNAESQFSDSVENGLQAENTSSADGCVEHSFEKFLRQHIKLAFTKGFDDNVGRYPTPAHFELPTVNTWFEIAAKLASGILGEGNGYKIEEIKSSLAVALDIDFRFSQRRCEKVLPSASAAYQENLPSHYTEEYHQTKLAHALQIFAAHARGPAVSKYAQLLKAECEKNWRDGRQMCEVLSLTGNNCINPIHRTESEPEDKTIPTMPHCSSIKLISTCNCGRKQAKREDPFDVKTANFDFYLTQLGLCCGGLEQIEFPVFQARTSSSQPAHISPVHTLPPKETEEKDNSPINSSASDANVLKMNLSEGNAEDNSLIDDSEQFSTDDQSQRQTEEGREEIIISIQDGSEFSSSKEKALTRQPSTTEYLPGMLHSESPLGLLPVFSSWSLICLGPSSLYSHNIGLQEQPGFIPGTNFLLPWDVTVKVENKERWPSLWEGKRPLGLKAKKAIRDGPQFNVKVFIGVEYECLNGHRFMCSGPDRVLKVTSSGLVKDNALKVTGCDMPLYCPCPCQPDKSQIAQLMRIHVVTPKAPVHVTLNPKVQPSLLPCPIFFPTFNEPLKLSQSAYWVLRLPFVYEGSQGPFLPPREPVPVEMCRLIKGTYNIVEQQSNR